MPCSSTSELHVENMHHQYAFVMLAVTEVTRCVCIQTDNVASQVILLGPCLCVLVNTEHSIPCCFCSSVSVLVAGFYAKRALVPKVKSL